MCRSFASGAMIFQQGEEARWLYIVLKGAAKTFRYSDNGSEAVVRLLQSDDILIENTLFPSFATPVYAQTTAPSLLLMVPIQALEAQTETAKILLNIALQCYSEAIQQIDCLTLKTPLERVGYYLLEKHIKKEDDSSEVILPGSKSAIASHLGMTPETFSRTLKQLKEQGIDVLGKQVQIQDMFALCEFCDLELASQCKNYIENNCPVHCTKIQKKRISHE